MTSSGARCIALALAMSFAAPAVAICPRPTGRWGFGPVDAVAAAGTRAYFGSGSVLAVADLTNPASVPVLGSVVLPDAIRGVAVAGNHVYVGANQAGLRIVDVANPAAPVEVGSSDTGSYAVGVAVSGHYVFVADGWDGMRVFDVANPAAPVEVGSFDTPQFARDVAVSGTTAYVIDAAAGLYVVDVADPAHPSQLGALALPGGEPYGVAVSGGRALVATTAGLYVVDVTNPASPAGGPPFVPACGPTLFDVAASGTTVYLASAGCGLDIVSIANPAVPTEVGSAATPGSAQGVAVVGPLALVAGEEGGLSVVDASTLASPETRFTIESPDATSGIAFDGDHAFLAAGASGLRVVTVNDPASPGEIADLPLSGWATSIEVVGHLAYVGANGGGLRIADVSDPSAPVLLGAAEVAGGEYDLAVEGTHAFTVNGTEGLQVFDVADPAHPTLVAALPLPGTNLVRIAVAGSHAFIADATAGLRVIDVATPAAPAQVAVLPIPGGVQSIVVAGSLAYVGDNAYSVHVVDVTVPTAPALVATVPDFVSDPADLFVANGYLIVGDVDSGISVLSLAVPAHPELVGAADTPGQAIGVAAAGTLVGVADWNVGAAFFDLSACPTTLCSLTCSASGSPTAGLAPLAVSFSATAQASSCGGNPTFEWDFGDGSPHSASQSPAHVYSSTGTYPWVVTALAGFHSTTCSGSVTVALPPPRHFDFGTATSPVAAGYTQVTHSSTFAGAAGYGWTSGVLGSRDRGVGSDLLRDLVFTPDAAFGLLLPPGDYDVTIAMGDAGAKHDHMGVTLEGLSLAEASTAAGQFVTRSQRVRVSGGMLDLGLHDLGGPDANVVINALAVTGAAPFCFDFGTPTSPLAPGCTRITPSSLYDEHAGAGWASGVVAGRDRGIGSALTRDFDFTPHGTFVADVANGVYDVELTLGDATNSHDQMGISLEGTLVDTVSTAAGAVKVVSYRVPVADGQLTVLLDDLGGSDPNVVIAGLVVRGGPAGAPGTLPSAEVPKPIADLATTASSISVPPAPGAITDVSVTLDITHTYDRDLAAVLVGPDGTRVALFSQVGGSGDDFSDTTFDDAADSDLSGAAPPFRGSFRPLEPLSAFDGKSCAGTWTLEVSDLASGDVGSLNTWWLTVATAAPAGSWRFDLGTPTSPLAAGYTRVSSATAYSPALGYGWLSGQIASRDRVSGGDVNRDFCFTSGGTFAIDVPPGQYDVSVVTGDTTSRHDQMEIAVEGGPPVVVTASAGEFPRSTFRVTVTDGQLTLVLSDGGGTDINVVVNSIEVDAVAP